MIPGAFSTYRKQMDNEHIKHIKAAHLDERQDMLARNRKLQHETSKRRRALAMKRKTELQKEEQRRQHILAKRREQIRQATEKYQRLNHNYDPKQYEDPSTIKVTSQAARGPTLEEALRAVRGPSPKSSYFQTHSNESIRAGNFINSNYNHHHQSSASFVQNGQSNVTGNLPNSNNNASPTASTSRVYGYHIGGSGRVYDQAREKANRNQLHSHSLRNMSNSRTLFEKQLEEQQRMLADQHKQDLQQFNAAIQSEIEKDRTLSGEQMAQPETEVMSLPTHAPTQIQRSESLSSLDSLEATDNGTSTSHPGDFERSEVVSNGTTGHQIENVEYDQLQPHQSGPCIPESIMQPDIFESQRYSSNASHNSLTQASQAEPIFAVQNSTFSTSSPSTGNSQFGVQRSVNLSSPNVAIVQPSIVYQSSSDSNTDLKVSYQQPSANYTASSHIHSDLKLEDASNDVIDQSEHIKGASGTSAAKPALISSKSNASYNGQLYQDSVPNYNSQVKTNGEVIFNEQPVIGKDVAYDNEEMHVASHKYQGMTKAWPSHSPVADKNTAVNQSAVIVNQNNIASIVSNASVRSNRTPATFVTSASTKPSTVKQAVSSNASNLCEALQNSSLTQNIPLTKTSHRPSHTPATYVQSQPAREMSVVSNYTWEPVVHSDRQVMMDDAQSYSSEGSDESDVARESKPEPSTKVVKGILKKSSSQSKAPLKVRSGIPLRVGVQSKVMHQSSSHSGSVRDSLEVTKDHLNKPKKKSVRFADLEYEEPIQTEDESRANTVTAKPPKPTPVTKVTENSKKETSSSVRPHSAKSASGKPENAMKRPRAASAGTMRRGPFLRPHPPSQPPSGRAVMSHNHHYTNQYHAKKAMHAASANQAASGSDRNTLTTSSSSKPTATDNVVSNVAVPSDGISMSIATPGAEANYTEKQTQDDSSPSGNNAVYNANGVRLDRTPTDDEINWLWENVRNCLSRENSKVTSSTPQESRQQAVVSQKFIDGNSLTPQCRTSTRVSNNYTNNFMGSNYPVRSKRPPADNRKGSLLQQRRQNGGGSIVQHQPSDVMTTQATIQDLYSQEPAQSQLVTANTDAHGNVSESMAAFLAAEQLSGQSLSESQIERAMLEAQHQQRVQNASRPQPKVPTALSIEEQKLMKSLEKLNERLRVVEGQVAVTTLLPKPPPYHFGAFKGRAPLHSAGARRVVNGTVSRHRVTSAPVARTTESSVPRQYGPR